MLFALKPLKWLLKAIGIAFVIAFVYWLVTFIVVWRASGRDNRNVSDAIVVLGAAQYNGTPSPDLQARLDHALELWRTHVAPIVVVTGGKQVGDRYTEAQASARYLIRHGVASDAILREVEGSSSWQSLQSAARFLKRDGRTRVTLVSDAYHSARIADIAEEFGLHAVTSPSHFIRGSKQVPYLFRESIRVAGGRLFGYGTLDRHQQVGKLVPGLAIMIWPIRRKRVRHLQPIRG